MHGGLDFSEHVNAEETVNVEGDDELERRRGSVDLLDDGKADAKDTSEDASEEAAVEEAVKEVEEMKSRKSSVSLAKLEVNILDYLQPLVWINLRQILIEGKKVFLQLQHISSNLQALFTLSLFFISMIFFII